MKKRIFSDVLTGDFYDYYIENVMSPLSKKVFVKLLDMYNQLFTQKVIDGYKTFYATGLSYMFISEKSRKFKINSVGDPILPVSWAKTNELNEVDSNGKKIRVYLTDDPYYYKISWHKFIVNSEMRYYKFIPCRQFKKDLANRIFTDPLVRLKYRSNTAT